MILAYFFFLNVFAYKVPQRCYSNTTQPPLSITQSTTTLSITQSTTTRSIAQSTTTTTPSSITLLPTQSSSVIRIKSGTNATLTYFTDTVFQCINYMPTGNALAINPLLLGFTLEEWYSTYENADSSVIPWCGKHLELTVGDNQFVGVIIDTCNPGDTGAFTDPNTGLTIGGKCGYDDVIDLYSNNGLDFLQQIAGDNFYQGDVLWRILD